MPKARSTTEWGGWRRDGAERWRGAAQTAVGWKDKVSIQRAGIKVKINSQKSELGCEVKIKNKGGGCEEKRLSST